MTSKTLPYLIVGQGIAGSLLAWQFMKNNLPFILIDKGLEASASIAAAGIVNPVTGRRVVKSWMIDELLPYAKQTYKALEEDLSIQILHEQTIVRSLFSVKEENLWQSKSLQEGYDKYLDSDIIKSDLNQFLQEPAHLVKIKESFRVDLYIFLTTFRRKLESLGLLLESEFEYNEVNISEDFVTYNTLEYEGIIFCEGWRVSINPWYKTLPLALNKGEALSVEIPDTDLQHMLKHKLFIVPQGNQTYWVGSNYQWEFEDDKTNPKIQTELNRKLNKILRANYKIKKGLAGIRPSTDQRRPILGTHPVFPRLHMFNGMGTKGTSLAPYWSEQLLNHLLGKNKLPSEVDVRSFMS